MSELTTIEVGGVKMEVDPRCARRVDTIKVGTRVKLFIKPVYGESTVHPGVVIGFEPFKELPTIIIAYAVSTRSTADIKFVYYNTKTKDVDMVVSVDDDLGFDRKEMLSVFDRDISKKEAELQDIRDKKAYFDKHFKQHFRAVKAEA